MRYRDAKKLHREDEVVRKSDGRSLYVVEVEIPNGKNVLIMCDDGNTYHHTEIT